MALYKIPKREKIDMGYIEQYEGESIEEKIERITQTNEPITDGAPIIFTEKKDGVKPEYDIRTDKWDLAQSAMDKVNGTKIAKSKEYMTKEDKTTEENGINTTA